MLTEFSGPQHGIIIEVLRLMDGDLLLANQCWFGGGTAIVKEGRISLSGTLDQELGVPTLVPEDMFAEKLLANADRCQDRSVAYRDAIDLGMLIGRYGEIPGPASDKAMHAYGADIGNKIGWVVARLQDREELKQAADKLQMDHDLAMRAIDRLAGEMRRLWPDKPEVDS